MAFFGTLPKRRADAERAAYGPRPSGQVVWIHCPDPARLPVAETLATSLRAEGDPPAVLVTLPQGDIPAPAGLYVARMPTDAGDITAFLNHWRPDLLLWMEGDLHVPLLKAAKARAMPALLIDANADRLPNPRTNWPLRLQPAPTALFDRALANDGTTARRLIRDGLPAARVEVNDLLDSLPVALPFNAAERGDLAEELGTRPVWLAAGVTLAELPEVILAQRSALRSAHRLLLVLLPADPDDEATFAAALAAAGLCHTLRAESDHIDENTSVLLADSAVELGLWYRLASISFMGGTLRPDGQSRHPFEPAALGSAVLAGPNVQPYGGAYLRLERAGAARLLRTGEELARAIDQLLAPDKAAAMALAAWQVTTTGADGTNRVVDLIHHTLEQLSAQ
ncbi:3-deoxy-D-manno-octulosonic-acid transferase [Ketogulonicigenium robustum]|uniref:3-deoxy-D-manno-octulosonic acid transferase n=1 Tax=Ketogulonicigenium robustum TaxID=92947 RepID=A0A1W6P2S5_9RHOB|nr:glycosyltransferase N-terminal domain-containing protein [Ketogulonicigenium robustum]ARO15744.1 3-deoxy-D-manno-octulosonic-acid transferase [Ketogulonicigenium robustum]